MTRWCILKTRITLGNVNPVGVRGVYDESKRFAEALTVAYQPATRHRDPR